MPLRIGLSWDWAVINDSDPANILLSGIFKEIEARGLTYRRNCLPHDRTFRAHPVGTLPSAERYHPHHSERENDGYQPAQQDQLSASPADHRIGLSPLREISRFRAFAFPGIPSDGDSGRHIRQRLSL